MAKAARGGSKPPPPTTLSDLILIVGNGIARTSISPNAQWAGIQKFASMTTTTGAISVGNWNYSIPPGEGASRSVSIVGTGYYRGWSSDFDGKVHVSNVVFVP